MRQRDFIGSPGNMNMNLGLYNNAEHFSPDTSPRNNNKNYDAQTINHESFMSYLKETSLPASPKNSNHSNFSVRNQARDFNHCFINGPTGFNE